MYSLTSECYEATDVVQFDISMFLEWYGLSVNKKNYIKQRMWCYCYKYTQVQWLGSAAYESNNNICHSLLDMILFLKAGG